MKLVSPKDLETVFILKLFIEYIIIVALYTKSSNTIHHGIIHWWNNLVSDNIYNNVNLQSPKTLQGMTNNVRLTFSVGDTTLWFTISIEQDD